MFEPGGYLDSGGGQTTPTRRRQKNLGLRPEDFGFLLLVLVSGFGQSLPISSVKTHPQKYVFIALCARFLVILFAGKSHSLFFVVFCDVFLQRSYFF